MADVPEGTVRGDPRMEFLSEYTLRSLRLKPDKWTRMLVSDEQRNFVNKFIDCYKPQVSLVLICIFNFKMFLNLYATITTEHFEPVMNCEIRYNKKNKCYLM